MAAVISKDHAAADVPQVPQIPPANADPQAVVNGLTADAESKGIPVHSFDPNATPAQKAASAGKARAELGIGKASQDTAGGAREVTFDAGTGPPVQPTITIEDVDAANATEKHGAAAAPQPMPGALPSDGSATSALPDYFKLGWRQVGGIDAAPLLPGSDEPLLSQFLSQQFYGAWYHDASVLVLAVLFTHLFTLLHLGWAWLFLVLATCATYYTTSNRRMRSRARDDIQRELVKNRLATEHESAEWINSFLDRFWLIYEPVLSATIIASVDQVLQTNTPSFLDSIRMSTFTLGTKAPRIDRVRTYPRTDDDVVLMEWGLSFTPNDVSRLTRAQEKEKVNPKIVLDIKVGAAMAKATLPILLEDVSFKAFVRIKLQLMTNFPHVKTLEISFLEKPMFDYVLKPLGGETFGFDIGNIPGLSAFIRDTVHGILGPMMYDPNAYTLDLAQLLSGTPLDAAIGVLQVNVYSARSLKGVKVTGGAPDPYVTLSINSRAELARTKWQPSTYNPYWGEVKFLLVTSLADTLTLGVMDYNDVRKDMDLGTATFDMAALKEDAVHEGVVMKVLKDGKERGELQFDVSFYPVLTPKKLPNGDVEPLPDTKTGILRITLHQAKELDHSKSLSNELNPLGKLLLGQSEIHKTVKAKHTNSPVWESSKEVLVPDRHAPGAVISCQIIDDGQFMKDPMVGQMSIRVDDLVSAKEKGQDWFPLSGCKSGRVRITAEWKPLNMAGSLEGAGAYVPPIGVVRMWVQKAVDVKNVEAALGGKSDPYVRVMLNGVVKARTEVVNNNLNPEWDQIIYVPVHQLRESLILEVMDYQHLTKDRTLGTVELKVSELATKGGDSRIPYKSTGKRQAADQIRLDQNSYKGQLHYVAEFVPSVHLKNATFHEPSTELDDIIGLAKASTNDAGGVVKSSPVDEKAVNGAPTAPAKPLPSLPPTGNPAVNADGAKVDKKGHARAESVASVASVDTTGTAETAPEEQVDEGIEMSKEEVLQSQSGIIAFNVIEGRLAKRARLEVLLDDGYWPAFSTVGARSTSAKWDQVGEGFIKELDFGRVWLRLNEKDDSEREEIVAELKLEAKNFLEKSLDEPTTFTLVDANGNNRSTIQLTTRYIPVEIQIEPRESVKNMGQLRVDLLDGKGIRGVDRSGKSDPFVVFTLNGQRVFKSDTKKKTLSPEWNENFMVSVPSRVAASFSIEVFDWNQIEQAKSLGTAEIDLSVLEPFEAMEKAIPITHEKHGDSGEIRIRMLFHPEIIARSRQATSVLGSAGRAMTKVGTMPIAGVRGVVTGVGAVGGGVAHGVGGAVSGVGHGVGAAAHMFGGKKDKTDKTERGYDVAGQNGSVSAFPDPPSAQVSVPAGTDESTGSLVPSNSTETSPGAGQPPQQQGFLKVTVLGAKDLTTNEHVRPYVALKVGEKEHKTKPAKSMTPEWDETFQFFVTPHLTTMHAVVLGHRTLGKDKELGEADIEIWRHVQPNLPAADVWVELRSGQGQLRLRLEYLANSSPPPRGSMSSPAKGSPSRFSTRS